MDLEPRLACRLSRFELHLCLSSAMCSGLRARLAACQEACHTTDRRTCWRTSCVVDGFCALSGVRVGVVAHLLGEGCNASICEMSSLTLDSVVQHSLTLRTVADSADLVVSWIM
jgi:hypothetical protein